MSSRSKMMGAGFAGSTKYNLNVNTNTSGGNKKQGLPPYTNASVPWAMRAMLIQANSTPAQRSTVFVMNQLGGVSSSSFSYRYNSYARSGGVHK